MEKTTCKLHIGLPQVANAISMISELVVFLLPILYHVMKGKAIFELVYHLGRHPYTCPLLHIDNSKSGHSFWPKPQQPEPSRCAT